MGLKGLFQLKKNEGKFLFHQKCLFFVQTKFVMMQKLKNAVLVFLSMEKLFCQELVIAGEVPNGK